MTTTLYKYTFVCSTESAEKNVWRTENEPIPSKCPDDTSHTIDTVSMRITEVVKKDLVKIEEEIVPTGGHFKCRTLSIDLAPNETKEVDRVYPFNISAMAIEFNTDSDNFGDNIELIVRPNTTIGIITNNVNIGNNTISVDSNVIKYIKIGYKINLHNGTETEDLGYVTGIDKDNLTITTEKQSTKEFLSATPTYVRMNIYVIEDYIIGKAGRWEMGSSKIGGSFIPAGTIVRVIYYNNSGISKNFTSQLEYLY